MANSFISATASAIANQSTLADSLRLSELFASVDTCRVTGTCYKVYVQDAAVAVQLLNDTNVWQVLGLAGAITEATLETALGQIENNVNAKAAFERALAANYEIKVGKKGFTRPSPSIVLDVRDVRSGAPYTQSVKALKKVLMMADGQSKAHTGEVNKLIATACVKFTTDQQVLDFITTYIANKPLKPEVMQFPAISRNRNQYTAEVLELNFVNAADKTAACAALGVTL